MDVGKRYNEPNPKEKAGPLSSLLFLWTIALFKKGYGKDLKEEDLYNTLPTDCSEFLGDKLERVWLKEVERSKIKKKVPSLRITILKAFKWELSVLGLINLFNELGIRLGQPILLGRLLSYFMPGSEVPREDALLYAGGIVLCSMLSTLMYNHIILGAFHLGMRIRAACCSLVYRKTMRLSRTALGETAAGKVVNLLSNDVSRFDMVSIFIHSIWTAPLSTLIITYFLWSDAGVSGLIGIGAVFIIVPLQAYTGKLTSIYRLQTAYKTDERIRLMDEIISGIRVIKMYAWEKPFSKMINLVRKLELDVIIKTCYLRGLYMTFNICTTRIALCCTLVSMGLFGDKMTADKVFVFSSYFNIMAFTMSGQFVRAIAEIAETLVSIRRLQEYLLHEEFLDGNVPISDEDAGETVVELQNVSAKWNSSYSDDTLTNINLRVPPGKLIAVIGMVGSGKSSLLQILLGELPVSSGTCKVSGKVSYACQEPWVFSGTVRQNIIFEMPFELRRYVEVVRVCALRRDFEQFPQGDMTIVGERGSSLSGGQKARINLARAVYRQADVYLLDDPLSAVDTHVGKHLFDECIAGHLCNKTRILVTHQLQYLQDADLIVILNNGAIEVQGTFEELLGSQVDYAMLLGMRDGPESGDTSMDDEPEDDRPHTPLAKMLRQISQTSSLRITQASVDESKSVKRLSQEEPVEEPLSPPEPRPELAEGSSKVKGGKSIFLEYFRAGGNTILLLGIMLLFVTSQVAASGTDYWISFWTTQEEIRSYYESQDQVNRTSITGETASDAVHPMTSRGDLFSSDTCMHIYAGLVVLLFFITATRSFLYYNICMRCSARLHHAMFNSVIQTGVRFFDLNPSGRILNRFSKDIGSIDEILAKSILDATQIILMMVGSLIVAVSVNYLFLVPIIVMGSIFAFIRKIYLKTSKNVKRLEGITKSPVFNHLNATLQGLTTIRSCGAQPVLQKEFDRHQDLHSSAWYMFITTSTAFGFSLDLLCVIYIGIVTYSFFMLEETFGGSVGLAITQSLVLTGMMQWGMRQSAEVANQLMSVERVLEYTNLEAEPLLEAPPDKRPPPGWPTEGRIELEKMSMKYSEFDAPVLLDLNLTITPTEKVGIVGRTGAGKSSLITALFRLAPVEGSIRIDGIDTRNLGLQDLRSRISIIPQDPVLFSGTLRKNLDPFEEYPDYLLWKALEDVELKDSYNDEFGLENHVAEGGSNFSVGQRQLVCLARAILMNNRVLMLDEATANVDPQTDALIQKTIRSKFAECTVLTVAHRLNTIMDSDKVLVMEAGCVAEFDHPHMLLQDKSGIFFSMVQDTGRAMAEQLAKVSAESFEKLVR